MSTTNKDPASHRKQEMLLIIKKLGLIDQQLYVMIVLTMAKRDLFRGPSKGPGSCK